MKIPTVFEGCQPRRDVLSGSVSEADFAADLAQVIVGNGTADYCDPERFFSNTYPTRGLRDLLSNVCRRLSGSGGAVAEIFRLDTSFGGGKSHGLIALCHAARSGAKVPNMEEFVDPAVLPKGRVRIAAFDGENADPTNGRLMKGGHRAFTPWGEIASALDPKGGYELVRKSDEKCVAPGAETLRELFDGEPTLILLDELSVYLRKAHGLGRAREQLTAFLTSLFKAVESVPNAALVFTLAIGKDGVANEAYSEENQFIGDQMAEAESISARKATLLNPTEEDETVQVLRRRLFESIDEKAANAVTKAYLDLWHANKESLPKDKLGQTTNESFRSSYPLHPEVLNTLTGKTATLGNFQRVRGMLRLLARTISHLWQDRPDDATTIHIHHIDPGNEHIRQEIVTRLEQKAFVPAILNDIASGSVEKQALAQRIDAEYHGGMPPYVSYVARTIFMNSIAFNESLKGLSMEELRYSMLGPKIDISFIKEAREAFISESAYLDDRPMAPMRFIAEANLQQIILGKEKHINADEARAQLNDKIREIFSGKTLEAVCFPAGPFEVADEVADGRPKLVVLGYDAVGIGTSVEDVPLMIQRIYERKGSEEKTLRSLRNNLIFVTADETRKDAMLKKIYRRLALVEMKKPENLDGLAEYQQEKVLAMEAKSEQELAIAIQQCYRHVFYPSRNRIETSEVDLAHSAIDIHSTSDRPGAGQQQVVRSLRDLSKMRLSEDAPDSPSYVRDRTPLKKGQITTLSLRDEFRRDPALPILVGDDIFVRGIRSGVETGEYVYQRGDLLFGRGDPAAEIKIDEQSIIFTMSHAKKTGIWPRKPIEKPDPQAEDSKGNKPDKPTKGKPGGQTAGTPPDRNALNTFTADGSLREALVQVWEQARNKNVEAIETLSIRMFEASDIFPLLGAVGSVSNANKTVTIEGGYESRDGGSFMLEFKGPVSDAQTVREFLLPQLRDASETDLEAGFELDFENGLSIKGDEPEKLNERLSRFAPGAAHVTATAKVKE